MFTLGANSYFYFKPIHASNHWISSYVWGTMLSALVRETTNVRLLFRWKIQFDGIEFSGHIQNSRFKPQSCGKNCFKCVMNIKLSLKYRCLDLTTIGLLPYILLSHTTRVFLIPSIFKCHQDHSTTVSFCLLNLFWEPVLTKASCSLEEPGVKGEGTMPFCLAYDSASGLGRDK